MSREFSYTSYAEILCRRQKRVDGTVPQGRASATSGNSARKASICRRCSALAVFDIRDRNRARRSMRILHCWARSKEAGRSGDSRVAPPWDLSGLHAVQASIVNERNGQALNYLYPKHSLKAWSAGVTEAS